MDFPRLNRLSGGMGADDIELARRLLTKAGMVMEDASAIAISTSGDDVEATLKAADTIAMVAHLLTAARVVQGQQ